MLPSTSSQAAARGARPAARPAAHEALPATNAARPRPLSEELSGQALVAYEQAKDLFEHQDYSTAHARFKQAYDASKNSRLLWNMAACSSKAKRYALAVQEAERFLSDGRGRITADQEARAKQMVGDLRQLVAEVRVEVAPAGASLSVDGEVVLERESPAIVLLEIGKHTLRVEKEGYQGAEQVLAVAEPKPFALRFDLQAIVIPAVATVTSRLVVVTDPEGVVELDGKALAKGTFDGGVSPGAHHLRIAAAGKRTYDSELDLAAGATRQLSVTLVEESLAIATTEKRGVWWPWAMGGVLALGAGVGAYFIFKPSPVEAPAGAGTLGSVDVH